jgi:RNA polymerase sigma-70 factor (ECF subfamily)
MAALAIPGTDGHRSKKCGGPVNLQRFRSSIVHDIKSRMEAGDFMSTAMIAPKTLETNRTTGRSEGEGADCFELVKMFGSRILRLAKYITESDADAEGVLVETFLKACADGSGSRADEGVRVRLTTIAVREALAKRCHRGQAEGEDNPCKDVVIREIFVWGDNYRQHHSPEQTAEILEQAMWSLDPICRAVFVLRDIEEIPLEQTALVLNRSVPALEACLLRARLQLREQLARSFRPALPSIEESLLGNYAV